MANGKFADQYKKNIESEQIEAVCPKCKQTYKIFPEHLGRADCETCNVRLVKA